MANVPRGCVPKVLRLVAANLDAGRRVSFLHANFWSWAAVQVAVGNKVNQRRGVRAVNILNPLAFSRCRSFFHVVAVAMVNAPMGCVPDVLRRVIATFFAGLRDCPNIGQNLLGFHHLFSAVVTAWPGFVVTRGWDHAACFERRSTFAVPMLQMFSGGCVVQIHWRVPADSLPCCRPVCSATAAARLFSCGRAVVLVVH